MRCWRADDVMRETRFDQDDLAGHEPHWDVVVRTDPAFAPLDDMEDGRIASFEVNPPSAARQGAHLHAAS